METSAGPDEVLTEVQAGVAEHPSGRVGVKNENGDKRVEYFCGIGRFRPKCLQIFRNPYFFCFLLYSDIFFGGALATGFISVTLSSIQRRYDLSATQSGLVVSVFDMAVIVSAIFMGYFGGKGHKPRWLGVGLMLQGLGAFIYGLPEFVFGTYSSSSSSTLSLDACNSVHSSLLLNNSNTSEVLPVTCDSEQSDRYALVFFIIGNLLIGFGSSSLLPIGASYLDDIFMPKYVAIPLGIGYAMVILGPGAGFGLGAVFLNIYVDFWEETDLEPDDPAYVGAWWLGFFFSCVMCWIISIPMLMFPKLLPNSHIVKRERLKNMAQRYKLESVIVKENSTLWNKIVSFPRHFWQVFSTLSWLFVTIGISVGAFVVQGIASFLPLYLETQFDVTSSAASVIFGATVIPTGAAGALIGGIIIFVFKATGRQAAMVNWIVILLSILPLLAFLVKCPTLNIVGVTTPYTRDNFMIENPTDSVNATCFSTCDCNFQSNVYQPVCGGDGLTYTSPCRAGCSVIHDAYDADMRAAYENCTCIEDNLRSMMSFMNYSEEDIYLMSVASDGSCDDGCNKLVAYLIPAAVSLLLLAILYVPNLFITLRCVADEQRTFALGMQSTIFRLFGSVPGPIVFGAVFDSACIFWNFEFPCGSTTATRGACWEYNRTLLSNALLAMVLIAVGSYFIFSFLSWVAYPKLKEMQKDHVEATNKLELTDANNTIGNHDEKS